LGSFQWSWKDLDVRDIAEGLSAHGVAFGPDGSMFLAGRNHAWVRKTDPSGNEVFHNLLSGGVHDSVNAIALDAAQHVHAAGTVWVDGKEQGFLAELDASGQRIGWTPYPSPVRALVLGGDGAIYVAGDGFVAQDGAWNVKPVAPVRGLALAADGSLYAAGEGGYVARLAVAAAGPGWGTPLRLAGSGTSEARAIAIGPDGSVYVSGGTTSLDFPVVQASQDHLIGTADAWLARITPDLSQVQWATYLGGHGSTEASAVAFDSQGNPVLAGTVDPLNALRAE